MKTYTNPSEFEEAVRQLLILGGYSVRGEILLGHKKIDSYAEERRLGQIRRIAVECKMYRAPLGQRQLTEIYANYIPLYKANLIDEIFLITDKGLSPSAQAMCLEIRELRHLTYSELESVIMDFSVFLRGIVDDYEQSGLPAYYVHLSTDTRADLELRVCDWLDRDDGTPLAILGSYGMGKTTFAKRIAYKMACDHLAGTGQRIPILLSLSEISSDQSLPGLLGKVFTAQSIVANYNFELFMRLNRSGKFLIILDGFDEMKHCLTWDSFCYNFTQIHRLVQGRSKVMVLGRPTAFLNEDEQQYILHGVRRRQGRTFHIADWPDYQELRVGALVSEQIEDFLRRYLAWKQRKKANTVVEKILKAIGKEQDEDVRKKLGDLAGRPVQLLMLAEVLPQWTGTINALSVATLYDLFIDNIIEREQSKLSRHDIGAKDRRAFARDIAWWLWAERASSLTADEIPPALVLRYCRGPEELEIRKRNLIAACFLSRKEGDALYFPHRSFQEFLVAEKVIEELGYEGEVQYASIAASITEDVQFFILASVGVRDLERWEVGLERYRGLLAWNLARVWLVSVSINKWLFDRIERSSNPWYLLFLTVGVLKGEVSNISAEMLARQILRRLELSPDLEYSLLCFFCLAALGEQISDKLLERCLIFLAERRVISRHSRKKRRRKNEIGEEVAKERTTEPLLDRFFGQLGIDYKSGRILLGEATALIVPTLRNYCFLEDWVAGVGPSNSTLRLRGVVNASPDVVEAIRRRPRVLEA